MMTRCLSSTDSGKAVGGRGAGTTQGGSSHAVRKTGRLDTLQPGAPVFAKSEIKFTCSDKFKRKFDDNGDDVIDDDDKEMKKRMNKAQFVIVLIFEFIDIIKFYIWILIYNLMKSSNKKINNG